jgi:hypothetical protein
MQNVRREAERHNIKLLILPTIEAIEVLKQNPKATTAILQRNLLADSEWPGSGMEVANDHAIGCWFDRFSVAISSQVHEGRAECHRGRQDGVTRRSSICARGYL